MIVERLEASEDLNDMDALEDIALSALELGYPLTFKNETFEIQRNLEDSTTRQETIMSHLERGFRY